jgi:hypothetical protein
MTINQPEPINPAYLPTIMVSRGRITPMSIPTLAMWWEADRVNSTDGTAVEPIDLGPNAVTITGVANQKALYKTNIVNGKPALLFDGTDDFYSVGSFTLGTLVVAMKYTLATFNDFDGLWTDATTNPYLIGNQSAPEFYASGRALTHRADGATYSFTAICNAWHVMSFTDASPITPSGGTWNIGRDRGTAGRVWHGYIYGMAAYTTALSAANLTLVERYFGSKVGISI